MVQYFEASQFFSQNVELYCSRCTVDWGSEGSKIESTQSSNLSWMLQFSNRVIAGFVLSPHTNFTLAVLDRCLNT